MSNAPTHGPAVPDDDTLYRAVLPLAAAVWFPNGVLSSAAFNYPVFSTDIARLTTTEQTLSRWEPGTGIVGFHCGTARGIGFDARHEPEEANDAHANVYSDFPPKERKRRARKLADSCSVIVTPRTGLEPPPVAPSE